MATPVFIPCVHGEYREGVYPERKDRRIDMQSNVDPRVFAIWIMGD